MIAPSSRGLCPTEWEWLLRRETRPRPPVTLRAETWIQASKVWASVTPVVLHHHPKRNRERDVQRIVMEAFESALLPSPEGIEICSVSPLTGVGHARSIPHSMRGVTHLAGIRRM